MANTKNKKSYGIALRLFNLSYYMTIPIRTGKTKIYIPLPKNRQINADQRSAPIRQEIVHTPFIYNLLWILVRKKNFS